jgi:hypothetical protein
MFNEGNQIHNFISSSGSGTVINYVSGSGSDFLTNYGSGSGSTSQKVTVPTVPAPVPHHCILVRIQILGTVPLTKGSECGSRRPKKIRILCIRFRMQILNTGTLPLFFKDKKS